VLALHGSDRHAVDGKHRAHLQPACMHECMNSATHGVFTLDTRPHESREGVYDDEAA
jgi:hypothetical protein